MKIVMVQYKVKSDRAEENVAYINKVFDQLRTEQPQGLQYASFRQADGLRFVNLSIATGADGKNPLTALAAFKAFAANVADRCDEPPVAVELAAVGSYRFFAT